MAEVEDERAQGLPDWFHDPVAVLKRRWRAMLAALLLGLVATGVVASLREPVYLAEAKVLLAGQKVAEDLVKPTMQGSPLDGIDAFAAEAMSIANLRKLIEELNLYPELRETMPMEGIIATMRGSIRIDSENEGPRPPPNLRFAKSRVIGIGFEANDPRVAASVATRLAHLFQAEGLRMRSEQARLATEFMRREVTAAESALRDQKAKIAAYEEAHRGELPSELDANQRRLERLQDQRDSLMTSAAEAETRLAQAIAQSAPQSSGATRLAEARAALARQRAVNTDTHPNVISLKREIAALERDDVAVGGGGAIVEAARREVAQYRTQIEETDAEIDALDARIARTPSHEAEVASMLQHAKVLEDNYLAVLGKLKGAELGESLELAQQGGQVSVLHDAVPPLEPEKGRLKIALAGVVASLGLAIALALLLELRDPVIATAQGVESIAGVPVLGVMPRVF
jgi:uncharacterized protein involved in exopolysaccharide biosynthesis